MLQTATLLFFPALMVFVAFSDLLTMTISNRVSIALAILFIGLAVTSGLTAAEIARHLASGALILALGFGLFALGWIGGGDAKLAAATAIWLGFDHLGEYALVASLLGGVLTLLILALRLWPILRTLLNHGGSSACMTLARAFLMGSPLRAPASFFTRKARFGLPPPPAIESRGRKSPNLRPCFTTQPLRRPANISMINQYLTLADKLRFGIIFLVLLIFSLAQPFSQLKIEWASFGVPYFLIAILPAAGLGYRSFNRDKGIAAACLVMASIFLFSNFAVLDNYLGLALRRPLIDEYLAGIDRSMGIDWWA